MIETPFEIFLVGTPGLEDALCAEAIEAGFTDATRSPGGVTLQGDWSDVWRANLMLRGATRVLARIGSFRAFHLAQLDKRARKFPWAQILRADVPVHVDCVTKASKIYHAGAATQRIARAISEELGAEIRKDAPLRVMARIEDNLVTISLDTTGESLHKRGHKEAVGKAPMRETMAAMFLRQCGYDGREPVLDPMCGSGTFVIEAAEIATGLAAGRARGFAFEHLANFDAKAWENLRADCISHSQTHDLRFYGSDRDTGAIRMAQANADRAGVGAYCQFQHRAVSDLTAPEGPKGLVMINPPYGARIGNRKPLFALHNALGEVLKSQFSGWRVGLVTSDAGLAKATALPFLPLAAPVAHGGLKVRLYQTAPLP
jgi:putative N6-adenine-specific DNA methylase